MDSGTSNDLRSIWGSGPNDVFAVGEYGTIQHYDGQQWTGTRSFWGLYGVWGSSSTDVYAVGGNYSSDDLSSVSIRHYDGNEWREIRRGGTTNLRSIWGVNDSRFAVGEDGAIWSLDNGEWEETQTPGYAHLRDVWGSSSTNVFAVGYLGTILRYNGSVWTTMQSGHLYCYRPQYLNGKWPE
jgi:hypothetical protein